MLLKVYPMRVFRQQLPSYWQYLPFFLAGLETFQEYVPWSKLTPIRNQPQIAPNQLSVSIS